MKWRFQQQVSPTSRMATNQNKILSRFLWSGFGKSRSTSISLCTTSMPSWNLWVSTKVQDRFRSLHLSRGDFHITLPRIVVAYNRGCQHPLVRPLYINLISLSSEQLEQYLTRLNYLSSTTTTMMSTKHPTTSWLSSFPTSSHRSVAPIVWIRDIENLWPKLSESVPYRLISNVRTLPPNIPVLILSALEADSFDDIDLDVCICFLFFKNCSLSFVTFR